MNHVTLMGRLCGEIELKRTQNGNSANYNRSPYPQNSRSSYQNGYYQNPFDGYETL